MMKNLRRKGFTLVELLIVIVVIGVLSAMMMLSSTEAVSSAKASNIISGLRNMKPAILSWYADNIDRVQKDGDTYKIELNGTPLQVSSGFLAKSEGQAEILKYLSNSDSISLKHRGNINNNGAGVGCYAIIPANKSAKWYICYNIGKDTKVREKLKSRATSVGLLGVTDPSAGVDAGLTEKTYDGEQYVAMFVLSIED